MTLENLKYIEDVLEGKSLEVARDNESFGEALAKAVEAISRVQDPLNECQRLEQVMPDLVGCLEDRDREEVLEYAKELARLASALVGLETREELERFHHRIDSSGKAFSDIIKYFARAWHTMNNEIFLSNRKLGLVLKKMPEMDSLGRELVHIADRGLSVAKESPSIEGMATVRELESKALICRDKLGGVEGAEDVTAFLVGVAQGTVTLEDLTPSVFRWLGDNGLLGYFFVNVGQRGSL